MVCNLPPPPSACFSPGTCKNGSCNYEPLEGVACDDGDPCSVDDSCAEGSCSGAPVVCAAPSGPECVDATTLRVHSNVCVAGMCEEGWVDTICYKGCQNGACLGCGLGAWTVATLSTPGNVDGTTIATDGLGGVHLVYGQSATATVEYLNKPPGKPWQAPVAIDSSSTHGRARSLAADSAGGVHVCYQRNFDLLYRHRSPSGTWQSPTTISGSGNVFNHSALAVDAAGGVHVSYQEAAGLQQALVVYGFKPAGGIWQPPISLSPGGSDSIAVEPSGNTHVSFHDQESLFYAHKPVGGAWQTPVVVDGSKHNFFDSSIAVDLLGGVHIAYYDGTDTDLRYLHKPPAGAWQPPVTVDADGDVGLWASIAAGSLGGVHIAYGDYTHGHVKFARKPPNAGWEKPIVIDTAGGWASWWTSIALDPAGGAHVSYWNATEETVKYAFSAGCE